MGRKVYHVWQYFDHHEYFRDTFTNKKEAREFAIDEHNEQKFREDYNGTTLSVYDLETQEHWDIWYSFMLEEKGGSK